MKNPNFICEEVPGFCHLFVTETALKFNTCKILAQNLENSTHQYLQSVVEVNGSVILLFI